MMQLLKHNDITVSLNCEKSDCLIFTASQTGVMTRYGHTPLS